MVTYLHTTFERESKAREAVQSLLDQGFATRDIEVFQRHGERIERVRLRHRTTVPVAACVGALLGCVAGVILGGSAHDALLAVPGTAPGIGEAASLGALLGAGLGVAGGLGRWQQEPLVYEDAGPVAVGVRTRGSRVHAATQALQRLGACVITSTSSHVAEAKDELRAVGGSHGGQTRA